MTRVRFDEFADLDRTVHEPVRLALLTALAACETADFRFLQNLLRLTTGNLSTHLTRLEEAGLVRIEKGFVGKVPQTRVHVTGRGRTAVERHWKKLQQLKAAADEWDPTEEPGLA